MDRAHPLERSHHLQRNDRGFVRRNIAKGDLVFTSGSLEQTKWEKDGETFYGVTLAPTHRTPVQGPEPQRHQNDEPQEQRTPGDPDDIPF